MALTNVPPVPPPDGCAPTTAARRRPVPMPAPIPPTNPPPRAFSRPRPIPTHACMPAFSFEALDAQGQTCKGLMEADTAKAARSLLRAQALVPLAVEPVQTGQSLDGRSASL